MNIIDTSIQGVKILEPEVFHDERGFFFESFNQRDFSDAIGVNVDFVQDNHSKSSKGVLRGLHCQTYPYSQAKIVRVIKGRIYDVAVDLRKNSPTFGFWVGVELSEDNKKQIWIPEGFAHGFLTLSEESEVVYKATNYYSPEHELSLSWNDPDINVNWPVTDPPVVSQKDFASLSLRKLLDEARI